MQTKTSLRLRTQLDNFITVEGLTSSNRTKNRARCASFHPLYACGLPGLPSMIVRYRQCAGTGGLKMFNIAAEGNRSHENKPLVFNCFAGIVIVHGHDTPNRRSSTGRHRMGIHFFS